MCILKWICFTLCHQMLYEREHFILRCGNIRLHRHGYMHAASLLPHWLQIQWNDDIKISDRVQPLVVWNMRTHARTHTHTYSLHWFRRFRLCGFIRTCWTNKECLRLLMRPLECGLRSLYNGNGSDRLWLKS